MHNCPLYTPKARLNVPLEKSPSMLMLFWSTLFSPYDALGFSSLACFTSIISAQFFYFFFFNFQGLNTCQKSTVKSSNNYVIEANLFMTAQKIANSQLFLSKLQIFGELCVAGKAKYCHYLFQDDRRIYSFSHLLQPTCRISVSGLPNLLGLCGNFVKSRRGGCVI